MRSSEIHISKPEIVATNFLRDQQVLSRLKSGNWVDASAAFRAIDRRDEEWNSGREKHRGKALIPTFTPLPLKEERLRPEGTRRERPPSHAHFSLD